MVITKSMMLLSIYTSSLFVNSTKLHLNTLPPHKLYITKQLFTGVVSLKLSVLHLITMESAE